MIQYEVRPAMRLCFLGTGGSYPTRDRNVVSLALTGSKETVLLDCGEGTQRQLIGSPVHPQRIGAILISHLHGDHLLGIAGLVQTMSLNGRERGLFVIGPEGIANSVERMLTSTMFTPTFVIKAVELEEGAHFEIADLDIDCSLASHGIPNLAFRIRTPMRPGRFDRDKALSMGIPEGELWGRLQRGETVTYRSGDRTLSASPDDVLGRPRKGLTIVYSGDTRPCTSVEGLASGADVLVHEATYSERLAKVAEEYGHSTAKGASALAKRAGVRRLFLVHASPRYSDPEGLDELLKEARSEYPDAVFPNDGEVFDVRPDC
jgi:ribonuclease Z